MAVKKTKGSSASPKKTEHAPRVEDTTTPPRAQWAEEARNRIDTEIAARGGTALPLADRLSIVAECSLQVAGKWGLWLPEMRDFSEAERVLVSEFTQQVAQSGHARAAGDLPAALDHLERGEDLMRHLMILQDAP